MANPHVNNKIHPDGISITDTVDFHSNDLTNVSGITLDSGDYISDWPNRTQLAADDTVASTNSASWDHIKTHYIVKDGSYTLDIDEIFATAEIRAKGGTGTAHLRVTAGGTTVIADTTTGGDAYSRKTGSADFSGQGNGVKTCYVDAYIDSGDAAYVRVYELWGSRG